LSSNKDFFLALFFILILLAIIIIFAHYGILNYLYLFLLIFFIFLLIIRPELIIYSYLVILPTNGIVPAKYNFVLFLGLDDIISILVLLYLIFYRNLRNPKKNVLQKYNISLIIIMIVIYFLTNIKNSYFNIYNGDYFTTIKILLSLILKYVPLIYILVNLNREDVKLLTCVRYGIYCSMIFLVICQFITPYLGGLDLFTMVDSEYAGLAKNVTNVERFAGFYNGDSNSFGAFLVMNIGFLFLQLNTKNTKKYLIYFFIGIAVLGVLQTASRSAEISLVIITLMFLYNNRSSKNFIQLLILLLLIIFSFAGFISNQISRFHNASFQLNTNLEGNRIMIWANYFNFFNINPQYLITGSHEEIYFYAAHNVYIQTIFNVGIFPLLYMLYILYRIIINVIKENRYLLYIIIPFVIITMYVGQMSEFAFFVLLITVSIVDFRRKVNLNVKQTKDES